MQPLAIDLFCGLGGWTEGLLAEGYRVVGFDNERHRYPARNFAVGERKVARDGVDFNSPSKDSRDRSFNYANECAVRDAPLTGGWMEYPAQLVLQDVLTLHGAQFKDAALIVASPPCQEYSYMAMPWTIAKQKAREYRDGTRDVKQLTAMFDACFRIQREACDAAGRHIPLVVENVRGAQPYVGRAKWHFGSFYLWGDVPALMPMTRARAKVGGFRFDGSGQSFQSASVEHVKVATMGAGWYPPHVPGLSFNGHAERAIKGSGGTWFTNGDKHWKDGACVTRLFSSKSSARKAASAHIAKIPLVLARHIARVYHPQEAL